MLVSQLMRQLVYASFLLHKKASKYYEPDYRLNLLIVLSSLFYIKCPFLYVSFIFLIVAALLYKSDGTR